MIYKSGRTFSLGHLLIPVVLFSLSFDLEPASRQAVITISALSMLWALFLVWHFFYNPNSAVLLQRNYAWFFLLVDFAITTALYTIPQWTSVTQPTWMILFLIPFYAFELGAKHALIMSLLGALDLVLFHTYQNTSFLTLDSFLIMIAMVVFVLFIGQRTDMLNRMAYYDSLTKLPNRQMFAEQLQAAQQRRSRQGDLVGLMFIDLDQFKYVNDTMGHAAGDRLLTLAAKRIQLSLPRNMMLARMGGDEFTVMIPHMKHSDEAAHAAEKIIDALKLSFPLNQEEVYVTASIGISVCPDDGGDADTLMKNADTAMYRAKEQGRNNYKFYTPSLHSKGIKRLQMETMLRHAIERDEMVVYYQPRMDTLTDELVAVEALVRWKHPELGMIPPGDFIPLAEDTGLIVQIGQIVLRKACLQRQRWTAEGAPPFRVSVNLSPRQFRQLDLPDAIGSVLKETGMPPALLELEITESAAMQDVNFAIHMLHVLKEMGLTLAIDDFGTGYSSLSLLKKFPIDVLKIDQSFISGIESSADDAAIAQTIIVLAHSLKLSVTAEGVETSGQYQFLRELKCDEQQGYLFGKPMDARTLWDWQKLRRELGSASGDHA